MGLLRSLARKVVGKVTGGGKEPASSSAPPARPVAPVAPPPAAAARSTVAKGVAATTVVNTGADPVVENAEALSTIECSPQEIKERLDAGEPVTVLDVREPWETAGGIIPGALRIPLGQLRERWGEVKNANEIVCYCAMGARSLQAATFLRGQGLFNATSLDGGISAWMECGGKVTAPA